MPDREEKAEQLRKELLDEDNYNRPTICAECGGIMVFKGVGEYKCEKCGSVGYDDYGKTRNYIEHHRGLRWQRWRARPGWHRRLSGA